ncbi:DNA-binding transcriptional LysR family regulator [Bradyrhizobium sp. S3.14.4]
MTATLDIATIKAFLLVADLQSFTRAAEALGTTQAAVSLKLQRLEALLGKRLVERSPRAVRLTADGAAFLDRARALMEAHDRALSDETSTAQSLSLGISDHAAGPELVPLLERLHAMSSSLTLAVTIGFSREMQDAYDARSARCRDRAPGRQPPRRREAGRRRVRLVRGQTFHPAEG